MDFSKVYFGKSLNALQYQDIKDFFSESRTETDQIEYKSINPNGDINGKLPGLIQSTCAFLNSNGGILIWGAPVGTKIQGQKEKVFTGSLTPIRQVIEKDWLISKLSDSIIPLPGQINVTPLNEGSESIFVFEIQKSLYPPHQTGDKFYMRIDGQTRPAPHHYIEALFKQIKFPDIEAYLKIEKFGLENGQYGVSISIFFCNWTPFQNEEDLHFRLMAGYGRFIAQNHQPHKGGKGDEYRQEHVKDILYYGEQPHESVEFVCDQSTLPENLRISLLLTFAGKYSPFKVSEYELDFSNAKPTVPNDIIVKRIENRLMINVHQEKGVNKKSLIESLMQ